MISYKNKISDEISPKSYFVSYFCKITNYLTTYDKLYNKLTVQEHRF